MTLPSRAALVRFARYALVGGGTFALDLAFIALMTELFGLPYYVSTAIGFPLAVSLNYFISRRFVFKGTQRRIHHGYAYFLGIALLGATVVTTGVTLLVIFAGMHYFPARILVACVVGMGNYLFNLYLNFRVVGHHA